MGSHQTRGPILRADRSSGVYDLAEQYDIAMSFKDLDAETDAVLAMAASAGVADPRGFVELAAGPARNAIAFAKRGLRAFALDNSPGMVSYARSLAEAEGVELTIIQADMTEFELDEPVEIAAIFMDSIGVLLDHDAILAHLDCVADALVMGGVYVLENGHPRDMFNIGTSVDGDWWETERDGMTVRMRWGTPDDPFDPITQISETEVAVTWEHGWQHHEVVEVHLDRTIPCQEFRALVRASGRFEIVAEHGSLDPDIPFSNEKEAWRYVPVLKRAS